MSQIPAAPLAGQWMGNSGEFASHIAIMLHMEPAVRQAVRIVQTHCLSGGLRLRFLNNNVAPTPSFERHVSLYYERFCRDAIEAMLAVGFVPYRIRKMGKGLRVPEVLPLGTYSWHVARTHGLVPRSAWSSTWFGTDHNAHNKPCDYPDTSSRTISDLEREMRQTGHSGAAGRGKTGQPQEKEEGEKEADCDDPLLRYNVTSVYSKDPVLVYTFEGPYPMCVCSSRLGSTIASYLLLRQRRECMMRADDFNSQPSVVFEQQDKAKVNDVIKAGSAVLSMGNNESTDRQSGEKGMIGSRQELHYDMLDEFRFRSRLTHESVAVIAPTNHTVHSLDRVLSPQEVVRDEMGFVRQVAIAVGIPPAMLLQSSAAVGGGASSSSTSASSSSGGGWADNLESNNRTLLATCAHINRHLESLLGDAYRLIYGGNGNPTFRIDAIPTVPTEQILIAFNAKLIDDDAASALLRVTWGVGLGKGAEAARDEQRKAEFILPFKDKKDAPNTKKAKK